jgi:hypothetical protein
MTAEILQPFTSYLKAVNRSGGCRHPICRSISRFSWTPNATVSFMTMAVAPSSVRSHQNGCKVRTNGTAPNRPFCASQQYRIEVSVRSICTIQMINMYGQDKAKTFFKEKEPITWHMPSNLFDRFDLFLCKYLLWYVRTVRYRTIATALPTPPMPVLVAYQRYRPSRTVLLVSLRTLAPRTNGWMIYSCVANCIA